MKRIDDPADVERFRQLVLMRLGLQFDDSKLGFLADVIQHRLNDTKLAAAEYLHRLEYDSGDDELPMLAKELTVPETYFFRNFDQLRVFRDMIVPERLQRGRSEKLTVLSAGCASGEEPYSVAIMLMSIGLDPAVNTPVKALDINPVALKKAQRGRYSAWAFRETPTDQQRRWFKQDGRDFVINEEVKKAVSFQQCNLAASNPDIWRPHSYDVIFCRNVLMYFSPDRARTLIAQMAKALCPGGYLFLGHAETLRGLSEGFHLCHTHGAFYYRVKDADETAEIAPSAHDAMHSPPATTEDWVQSIHRASERVQALSKGPGQGNASVPSPRETSPNTRALSPPVTRSADMAPVFALLHRDKFDDALTYVRELPQAAAHDPDVLLVEAMLLVHAGETKRAEDACQHLLQIDEMNASAHHVLSLCREAAGDIDGAMEQDRIAAYLDPTFAMPHLHMGLLGRRSGNRRLGERELAQALPLLRYEDGARILLFGGGFNRQSMLELCASALRDCGGTP